MEYAKKAAFGTYKTAPMVEANREDNTHVLMTHEEYYDFWSNGVDRGREAAEKEARKRERKLNDQIESLKIDLERARAAAENAVRLNINLLRINRERANADRNLRPKRAHTGYCVLYSREKEFRYGNTLVALWETTVQTPFSVDYDENTVRAEVKKAMFLEQKLMAWIGVQFYQKGSYLLINQDKRMIENWACEDTLSANYRSGYWECTFRHTKPLGQVPAEMRP